jgi:hypothetical protein
VVILFVVILLMVIHGYSINVYSWLFVVILLMVICGYSVNGYSWLFY